MNDKMKTNINNTITFKKYIKTIVLVDIIIFLKLKIKRISTKYNIKKKKIFLNCFNFN